MATSLLSPRALLLTGALLALTGAELERRPALRSRVRRPAAPAAASYDSSAHVRTLVAARAAVGKSIEDGALEQAGGLLRLLEAELGRPLDDLDRQLAEARAQREIDRALADLRSSLERAPSERVLGRPVRYHQLAHLELDRRFGDCDDTTFQRLMERVVDPARQSMAVALMHWLAKRRDARASWPLVKLATDFARDRNVRVVALQTLGQLDSARPLKAAASSVEPLVFVADERLAQAAIDAWVRLNREQAHVAAKRALGTLEEQQRKAFAQRLQRYAGTLVDRARVLLSEQKPAAAQRMIRARRWLEPAVAPMLEASIVNALGDPQTAVRLLLPHRHRRVTLMLIRLLNGMRWPDVAKLRAQAKTPALHARWKQLLPLLDHAEARDQK